MEVFTAISAALQAVALWVIGRHWKRHQDCGGSKRMCIAFFLLVVSLLSVFLFWVFKIWVKK